MSERAICRYNCRNCDTELEHEGFIAVDAEEKELVGAVLDQSINQVPCPNCGTPNRLPMPLLYHDGKEKLLLCYLPGASQMDMEEIAEAIRIPYEMVVTDAARRMGIEFPEPDPAAFPRGEENLYSPFSAMSQEQAAALLPEYLLRPTIVDGMEVVAAVIQAIRDGMETDEVLDDMARLQLINAIISTREDPISRRKVLHRNEPYLNEELFEVIDTLSQEMGGAGNSEMVASLSFVRKEVERYKAAQEARLKKAQKPE